MKKHWFTMAEVLIIVVVISTSLITILMGITKTTSYISEMRQKTIAMNLAKEGIESVFNIRNTNWRRRSASKDACWLKAVPMTDEGNPGCEDDAWMLWGFWTLVNGNWGDLFLKKTSSKVFWTAMQEISLLVKNGLTLKEWMRTHLVPAETDVTNSYNNHRLYAVGSQRLSHENFMALSNELEAKWDTDLGKYWRFIVIDGVYPKNSVNNLDATYRDCTKGGDFSHGELCWSSAPKELRFCSMVMYSAPYQGVVSICAVMTNYLE